MFEIVFFFAFCFVAVVVVVFLAHVFVFVLNPKCVLNHPFSYNKFIAFICHCVIVWTISFWMKYDHRGSHVGPKVMHIYIQHSRTACFFPPQKGKTKKKCKRYFSLWSTKQFWTPTSICERYAFKSNMLKRNAKCMKMRRKRERTESCKLIIHVSISAPYITWPNDARLVYEPNSEKKKK